MQIESAKMEGLIEKLQHEFRQRRLRNNRYSLRSFAAQLGISAGALSEIINGRRAVGLKTLNRIEKIVGDPSVQFRSSKKNRILNEDELALVGDGLHYTLVELFRIKNPPQSLSEIASRLGVTTIEARTMLSRLERINLIKKIGQTYQSVENGAFTTSCDVPSKSLQAALHQDLSFAGQALDRDPVEERDFSSVTLPFDGARIKEAKQMIKEFRRAFDQEFGKQGHGDDVYQLNIQFFRMTRVKGDRK